MLQYQHQHNYLNLIFLIRVLVERMGAHITRGLGFKS